MIIGYARVSTTEQNNQLQLDAFHKAGIQTVYEETKSSVKARPVLQTLLARLKPGDCLCIYKLDRLARSMLHLTKLVDQFQKQGIALRSLTESIDTTTAQGRMFLQLLGVFAEYERELIRERCLAGQIAARAKGKTWGKKPALTPDEAKQVAQLWRDGWAEQKTLAEMFGMSEAGLRDSIHRAEGRGRWKKSNNAPSDK